MTSRVNIATRDYLESRNRLSKEEKEGMKWMNITLVWKSKGLIELRGRAFSEKEGRKKGHIEMLSEEPCEKATGEVRHFSQVQALE